MKPTTDQMIAVDERESRIEDLRRQTELLSEKTPRYAKRIDIQPEWVSAVDPSVFDADVLRFSIRNPSGYVIRYQIERVTDKRGSVQFVKLFPRSRRLDEQIDSGDVRPPYLGVFHPDAITPDEVMSLSRASAYEENTVYVGAFRQYVCQLLYGYPLPEGYVIRIDRLEVPEKQPEAVEVF